MGNTTITIKKKDNASWRHADTLTRQPPTAVWAMAGS